jgi:uncharacterized membrane protein YhhN
MPSFIIPFGGIVLFLLLFFEQQKNRRAALFSKTTLSFLFVLVAFLQPPAFPPFPDFLICGLLLCLAGDVLLAIQGETTFKLGLLAFLLGHVIYIFSFSMIVGFTNWTTPEAFVFPVLSGLIFIWLRPHLKKMTAPVFLYILLITIMAFGAVAVFSRSDAGFSGKAFILAGAFFFYISDIFVARDKFIRQTFTNRLVGLPLYYAGQFLLAFSPGYL